MVDTQMLNIDDYLQSYDNPDTISSIKTDKPLIMVIDDDEVQLKSLSKILSNDYELILCNSGEKAIALFQKYMDSICSVVADIRLPGIDGFSLFKKVKDLNHSMPVIFITGYQEYYDDPLIIYRKYRPHGYIVKNQAEETDDLLISLEFAVMEYQSIREKEENKRRVVKNEVIDEVIDTINTAELQEIAGNIKYLLNDLNDTLNSLKE